MLSDSHVTLSVVTDWLDELSAEDCLGAVHGLNRNAQRRLYKLCETSCALNLLDFVPQDAGFCSTVVHHGRNTLPLPRKHRFFEKRFSRPEDGSERLFGYNEAPSRALLGPGYFVARPTEGTTPDWEQRGSVVIDYFQVPEGAVPSLWPKVVPNDKGLQRFVYHRTRDFMRRVTQRVTIGAAFKGERPLDHYFVLFRENGS